MTIGNKTMKKNGVAIELDVPPQIVNGRTLVRPVQLRKALVQKWTGTAVPGRLQLRKEIK